MKKILYSFAIISVYWIIGCTDITNNEPPTQNCDNEATSFTLGLDFGGASYLCTSGPFGTSTPPNASFNNYLNAVSANGTIGSLSNSQSYLCQITCKNDQPSENPSSPCTNPGMLSYTWNTAGALLAIQDYKNHNSDITVDYYDICQICSSSIPEARPYFVGVATVPAGVHSANIPLQTQQPYVGSPDPCQ